MVKKPWHKQVLRKAGDAAFPKLVPWVINTLKASVRVHFDVHPEAKALLKARTPVIYAIWHGRLFTTLFLKPRHDLVMLVSRSRDGQKIVKAARGLGFRRFIRGSSGKEGAIAAVRGIAQALAAGRSAVVTVDGPRGPRFKVKPGVIAMAAKSGVPIVPVTGSMGWMLVSPRRFWDRFFVSAPFGPVSIAFGAPIHVAEQDDPETARQTLETELQALTMAMDAHHKQPNWTLDTSK